MKKIVFIYEKKNYNFELDTQISLQELKFKAL